MNRLTGRQKKNCNLIIADNENRLNTDNFAVSNLFNEKIVPISKTLVASIPIVPFTTEGLGRNEKSLFCYSNDSSEISKNAQNLKNHKAAGLDGLTAEISKISADVICDRLNYFASESLSSGAKVVPIFRS